LKNRSKALGLWTALGLVVGNMVGAGAYLVPASLGAFGSIGLLGWVLTSLGAIFLALVFGRLGRVLPVEGGPYTYTRETMGDLPAFLVAWGYWISVWVGNAGIATAFAAYLTPFFPALNGSPLYTAAAALGAIWLLTALNIWGLREAALVQLVTTVLKILPLLALGTVGLLALDSANLRTFNVSGQSTISALTATAALTLWGFLGLESATLPADEVENPGRTIPIATILGTVATAGIYLLSATAVMGIIPASELAGTAAPYTEAATRVWGSVAGNLVGLGAVVAGFGVLNGWVLMQGQMPLAPARDGLFPRAFSRLSSRGTPTFGLVLSSCLASVLVAANYTRGLIGLFNFAVLLATVTVLASYLCTSIAQILYIRRDPARFGSPSVRKAIAVAALAFTYSCWAVVGAGWEAVGWGVVLMALGLPVYRGAVSGRRRRAALAEAEAAISDV
jgi:APA family basic amino acid/polyamine antiporter